MDQNHVRDVGHGPGPLVVAGEECLQQPFLRVGPRLHRAACCGDRKVGCSGAEGTVLQAALSGLPPGPGLLQFQPPQDICTSGPTSGLGFSPTLWVETFSGKPSQTLQALNPKQKQRVIAGCGGGASSPTSAELQKPPPTHKVRVTRRTQGQQDSRVGCPGDGELASHGCQRPEFSPDPADSSTLGPWTTAFHESRVTPCQT